MIVVDASAFVEFLTDEGGRSAEVAEALAFDAEWAAPEHAMTEIASAIRGLWLAGRCSEAEFDARLAALSRLEILPFGIVPLLPRIRALAQNAGVYDAAYLALAERLDAPLLTVDRKLARVPGTNANVRVIAAS